MSVPVNIEVSSNILEWVKTQVPPAMVDEISILDKWLAGTELPTVAKIRKLSQKIHIPFGYFFLETPPNENLEIMRCRTIESAPIQQASRNFIDTFNSMSTIQEWMSEYKRRNGFETLPFVGSFKESNNSAAITQSIRQKLELQLNWSTNFKFSDKAFSFLREKISSIGVIVIQNGVVGNNTHRPLSVEEFRAFTLIDEYAPLIFINSKDSSTAKIFSLVHELAHIWLGKENLFNDSYFKSVDNHAEQICNAVAAEIIVPKDIFISAWQQLDTEDINKIESLAKSFCCSSLVIARRALEFNLISKKLYEKFAQNLSGKIKSNQNGGNFFHSLKNKWDKYFILALDNSTKSGETLFLDAYRLTGISEKNFNALVEDFSKRQVQTA